MLNGNNILFMSGQKISTSHWKRCYEIRQLWRTLKVLISKKFQEWLSIRLYVDNEIIRIQNPSYFNHKLGIIAIHFYWRIELTKWIKMFSQPKPATYSMKLLFQDCTYRSVFKPFIDWLVRQGSNHCESKRSWKYLIEQINARGSLQEFWRCT